MWALLEGNGCAYIAKKGSIDTSGPPPCKSMVKRFGGKAMNLQMLRSMGVRGVMVPPSVFLSRELMIDVLRDRRDIISAVRRCYERTCGQGDPLLALDAQERWNALQMELAECAAKAWKEMKIDLETWGFTDGRRYVVRSSGMEDGRDGTNAGGYRTVLQVPLERLADSVGAVLASGISRTALLGRALEQSAEGSQERHWTWKADDLAIGCIIQPSCDGTPIGAKHHQRVPQLSAEVLSLIYRTHESIERRRWLTGRVETEWVSLTDWGAVSVSALHDAPLTRGGGAVLAKCAFGIGAAVEARDEYTMLAAGPVGDAWFVGHRKSQSNLRLTPTRSAKTFCLQARPFLGDKRTATRVSASDQVLRRLQNGDGAVLEGEMLVIGRRPRVGRLLVALDVDQAWRTYLEMSGAERSEISGVVVNQGTPMEHSSIMLNSLGIPTLRVNPDGRPVVADWIHTPRSLWCLLDSSASRALCSFDRCALDEVTVKEAAAPTMEEDIVWQGFSAVELFPQATLKETL